MRNVFVTVFGVKDVSFRQSVNALFAALAGVHINLTIEDCEDFGPIVDMPKIRLIGPMEPDSHIVNSLDVQRFPRRCPGELA